MQNRECTPFILLSEASTLKKWQSVCSYAIINQFQAVAAAMALHPVATASAVQLAASSSSDLGPLVLKALQWSSSELPLLRNLRPLGSARRDDVDLTEYLWEATEDRADKSWKAAPPQCLRTGRPSPRPPHRLSPRLASSPSVNLQSPEDAALVAWGSPGRDSNSTNEKCNGSIPQARPASCEAAAAAMITTAPAATPPFAGAITAAGCPPDIGDNRQMPTPAVTELTGAQGGTKQQERQQQQGRPAAARTSMESMDVRNCGSLAMGSADMDSALLDGQGGRTQEHGRQKSRQTQQQQQQGSQRWDCIMATQLQLTELPCLAASQKQEQQNPRRAHPEERQQQKWEQQKQQEQRGVPWPHEPCDIIDRAGQPPARQLGLRHEQRVVGCPVREEEQQQQQREPETAQPNEALQGRMPLPTAALSADGADVSADSLSDAAAGSDMIATGSAGDEGKEAMKNPGGDEPGPFPGGDEPGPFPGGDGAIAPTPHPSVVPTQSTCRAASPASVQPCADNAGPARVANCTTGNGLGAILTLGHPGEEGAVGAMPLISARQENSEGPSRLTSKPLQVPAAEPLRPEAAESPEAVAVPQPPPPRPALFDVLRMLPAHVVWRNLLSRIGVREACALRLLSRDWDEQVRNEWGVTLRLVLGADCVRELRRRVEGGFPQSFAARYTAVSRLHVLHRRIERTIFPNTRTVGSSGLLEVPPVVVDDAPPLAWVLQTLVGEVGSRLRRLHVSSDSTAVSELDLELISVLVPNLEELVIRFDCHEQPAPALGALGALQRLRRLAIKLGNEKLYYDPRPELMVQSLDSLTGLRCLSLELTASSLPLPGRALEHLTGLRLAVVFRGYSAGMESEQLRGLVSELGHLTALRALAVPDGYRGIDGDLLRAASMVLPSLTTLLMPRLSVTRDELAALARLPMLQHVTLGSVDIAPDADYEDLLLCNDNLHAKPRLRFMATWRSFHDAEGHAPAVNATATATAAAAASSTWYEMASGSSSWSDSHMDAYFVSHVGGNDISENSGVESNCDGNGGGGGGGGSSSSSSRGGVLRSMASWRQLVLCGEQRMEALVAAGPLPPGLRELRVEQLQWPRGSRADDMTLRSIHTLLSFCADVADLPYAAVHLSLEALSGAATATFLNPASEGRGVGSSAVEAAELAAAVAAGGSGAGGSRRPSGCSCVRDVVLTSCSVLGQVPGLKTLRWWGLLPLLAHLDAAGISQALGNLQQVSELEILGGLRGAHPSSSPLFLLHLARGLEAMPRLRRLKLTSTVPHNDALAQGLPGFLVALRRPLRVEVGFVTYEDAAALRNLMARSAAAAVIGAARDGDGRRGEADAAGSIVNDGNNGWATVLAWDESSSSGRGGDSSGHLVHDEPSCYDGWERGDGLWWRPEEGEDDEA